VSSRPWPLPATSLQSAGAQRRRCRILFVFAWLVVGGEETEVRLLAKHLNPARYQLEVVACFRKPNMPQQTHEQLAALGVTVDQTPYTLSFEETVAYLAHKLPQYDLVVACQAVPDVYPALERLAQRPPLIEHGGLVDEALAGPKHFTSRYVGVCQTICQAAQTKMVDRPHHVLEIPSMVDLAEFDPTQRAGVRAGWQVDDETPVVGWVGRLDRKKRVEDFIRAAALVHHEHPSARFLVIGGPDAFMPDYAEELQQLAHDLGLGGVLHFLGDRPDVPALLAGLDIFVWLSRGEGMPHVISEAGAAGLPVVATCDNGTEEQITHGATGLFVPHEAPEQVAASICQLIDNPLLRQRLGRTLRRKVELEYSATVLVRRWERLFDEVIAEHQPPTIASSSATFAPLAASAQS
jgi:polysaccharide biosynthesis protein PelF